MILCLRFGAYNGTSVSSITEADSLNGTALPPLIRVD